jgi:TRAP-type C4-dicarboxylate transport system substrate-binding protein
MIKSVKKGFGFTLLITILVLVLAACGGSDSASNDNQGSNDAEEKETYDLTMNVTFPAPKYDYEPKAVATEKFAELVKERTEGRVNIEIFYSNQLVPREQGLDALESGTVDIESAGSYWGDQAPTQDFLWLPYGFYGPDHLIHVMRETEAGEIYKKGLKEHGAKVLMYWPSGNEGIISKDPITKIEDMKGKSIRLGSGLWTNWYKEMGAAPVNLAGGEQYEALLRGTIDGAMYPFYTIDTYKFHEVTNHVTVPSVLPILTANYISLKSWNQLPEDIQQTITDVAKELEVEAVAATKKMTENALQNARENGMTVHELSDEEYEKFQESAQVVWEEFASRNEDTKRMVEILRQDLEEYKEKRK